MTWRAISQEWWYYRKHIHIWWIITCFTYESLSVISNEKSKNISIKLPLKSTCGMHQCRIANIMCILYIPIWIHFYLRNIICRRLGDLHIKSSLCHRKSYFFLVASSVHFQLKSFHKSANFDLNLYKYGILINSLLYEFNEYFKSILFSKIFMLIRKIRCIITLNHLYNTYVGSDKQITENI